MIVLSFFWSFGPTDHLRWKVASSLWAQKILTLHRREEYLGHGCSLGPFVLWDGFSVTGLTAQSHVALHHGVSCHGAHWGRGRDWRGVQTDTQCYTFKPVIYGYRINDPLLNLYISFNPLPVTWTFFSPAAILQKSKGFYFVPSAAGGWHNGLRAMWIPKQQMSFICTVLTHTNTRFFNRLVQSKILQNMFSIYSGWISKSSGMCEPRCRLLWLNVTSGIALTLRSFTFDIKVYLSVKAIMSGDEDTADIASRVRLLGVVDVDGEVRRGHGHTEAHPRGELALAEPDLTWAEVYHLHRGNTFMATLV